MSIGVLKVIDVEEAFSDFVEKFGGEVSDRTLKGANKPSNADYLFHREKVVAELKLLKEDPFKNKEFKKALAKKTDEWLRKGYITRPELSKVTKTNQLPDKCYQDVEKLYIRSIKNHIEKANKQIKETKQRLGLSDYKGLLFLASDGNYFLQPRHVKQAVEKLLASGKFYTSISTVLYFTVNIAATIPNAPHLSKLWVALYRLGFERVPTVFLDELFDKWVAFYEKLIGIDIEKLSSKDEDGIDPTNAIEEIKFIVP